MVLLLTDVAEYDDDRWKEENFAAERRKQMICSKRAEEKIFGEEFLKKRSDDLVAVVANCSCSRPRII
jgi:hypothetical protein